MKLRTSDWVRVVRVKSGRRGGMPRWMMGKVGGVCVGGVGETVEARL